MTQPTPEEARQALADIAHISQQMRHAVGDSIVSTVLMLWGGIWLVIFTLSYLQFPKGSSTIPWIFNGIGFAITFLLVLRGDRQVRGEATRMFMLQMLGLWVAVIAFGFALSSLLPLGSWIPRLALLLSVIMLGFVTMGIWLKDGVLVVLGLVVALVILLGRAWLAPAPFLLALGILGGGSLFAGGLVIHFRWR